MQPNSSSCAVIRFGSSMVLDQASKFLNRSPHLMKRVCMRRKREAPPKGVHRQRHLRLPKHHAETKVSILLILTMSREMRAWLWETACYLPNQANARFLEW